LEAFLSGVAIGMLALAIAFLLAINVRQSR
jgi:hypothetical protein